jgi:hypothetical protein
MVLVLPGTEPTISPEAVGVEEAVVREVGEELSY